MYPLPFQRHPIVQIPGGLIARRVGGKNLFAVAIAGCSVLSLLTPMSARFHVAALIALRVLQGCLQVQLTSWWCW